MIKSFKHSKVCTNIKENIFVVLKNLKSRYNIDKIIHKFTKIGFYKFFQK